MVYALKVIFSGNVQGVGFRYTAYQLAKRFSVTGTVKNLNDGRVALYVESLDQKEVNNYFQQLKIARKDFIEAYVVKEITQGEKLYSDFRII